MQYNPKISQNGGYLDFYGWSVISMLDNDLKFCLKLTHLSEVK